MTRQTMKDMLAALDGRISEIFPWDLQDEIDAGSDAILVDVRCPPEFQLARIEGSINVPRGVLELAVDWGYEETVPELVQARDRRVVLICRSGNRSVLAAHTMALMGFSNVQSLKTGIKGWNDNEQPLVDGAGHPMDLESADAILESRITQKQLGPDVHRQPDKMA